MCSKCCILHILIAFLCSCCYSSFRCQSHILNLCVCVCVGSWPCALWALALTHVFVHLRSYVYLLIIHYFPTCGLEWLNDQSSRNLKGWRSMKYYSVKKVKCGVWQRVGADEELTWLSFHFCPFLALEATLPPFIFIIKWFILLHYQQMSLEKKMSFKSKPWAKPEPCVLYGLPLFSQGLLIECTMFLGCCFLAAFVLCSMCLLLKT